MLSFRMEGGSSPQAISTMMRRLGLEKYSSMGYISETLSKIGGLLPNTIKLLKTKKIVIASDEIFSKSQPILIDVDPINSILRPYLDRSKNQVTQEFLNFFAFYHNHRVYNDGKRNGKIPMEILTNQKQGQDWIELLVVKDTNLLYQ
ncbi:MAG: hypothetical protein Q9M39_00425 [Sulfurovum sp.]|nr:hypothetical protein [Sulfurovum sp.]